MAVMNAGRKRWSVGVFTDASEAAKPKWIMELSSYRRSSDNTHAVRVVEAFHRWC